MKNLNVKIHWSFLVLCVLMVIYGKFFAFVSSILCVVLHEMGHSFVGRKLGYKLNMITLMPYGAMLSGQNKIFSFDDEIKIAIAGPLVNVFLFAISLIICLLFPTISAFAKMFAMCNIFTFCFNILPVYPMDGGRILLAILSKKFSRKKSQKIVKIVGYCITIMFFVLFFVSFFYKLNYMLGINAMFMLIGLVDENRGNYYETLVTFDKFQPSNHKTMQFDGKTPIFLVYKSIVENNPKDIVIVDKDKHSRTINKNYVLKRIIELPIDTKIENV